MKKRKNGFEFPKKSKARESETERERKVRDRKKERRRERDRENETKIEREMERKKSGSKNFFLAKLTQRMEQKRYTNEGLLISFSFLFTSHLFRIHIHISLFSPLSLGRFQTFISISLVLENRDRVSFMFLCVNLI